MGMILLNQISEGRITVPFPNVLPASNVDYLAREEILSYFFNNQQPNGSNAFASIHFNGTQFGFLPSPTVPSFSSRGPSFINGGLIKPDVLAPGTNILAAWHEGVGPNPDPLSTRNFNFESGTSMSAPHVSGIVALLRSRHRDWTPAEVISAVVTTANDTWFPGGPDGGLIIDESTREEAGIYVSGAGVITPIKAMDPGLVFGLGLDDYMGYMCGLGYSDAELTMLAGEAKNCSKVKQLSATDLNYPSIVMNFTRGVKSQTTRRTAKNVGEAREEYKAVMIKSPEGMSIDLSTYSLKFSRVKQEVSFDIQLDLTAGYPKQGSKMIRRGKIVWGSGKHDVTIPIAVRFA